LDVEDAMRVAVLSDVRETSRTTRFAFSTHSTTNQSIS